MIEVREVRTKADLRAFISFPDKLYKDCPYYVPCLHMDEKNNLLEKSNPAYEYCETKILLAYKDGKLAGRVLGILNRAYNEKFGKKRVRFNRWDVIDDIEVAKALLTEVERWGAEKGMTEITGPIGFCDMDHQGLLVEGFEEKDLFITTYNYPYYAEHLDRLGYVKDVDWIEMQISMPEQLSPKIKKVSELLLKKHDLHLMQFTKIKEVLPRVDEIFDLLNEAYSDLYGTVPLNAGQVQMYKEQFIPILNPKYISIVENNANEIVGFGIAAPSMAEASIKSKGKLFPLGWLRILRSIRKNDTIELLLVAVRKDYRNTGVNAIMISQMYDNAAKSGIRLAETGPELELNDKVQSQWKSFETRQHKRRRCYVKPIEL